MIGVQRLYKRRLDEGGPDPRTLATYDGGSHRSVQPIQFELFDLSKDWTQYTEVSARRTSNSQRESSTAFDKRESSASQSR
jgi:hypothetical protein